MQLASQANGKANAPLCFWSETGMTRYDFLEAIRRRLQQAGWTHRVDTGWDPFDLEITATRWGAAQFTTTEEQLAHGRSFFRCRVGVRSSWWAPMLVVLSTLAALILIVLFREKHPLI